MSAQWAVGAAEMRQTSQPKRAMRPLQGSSATIEVAESEVIIAYHIILLLISRIMFGMEQGSEGSGDPVGHPAKQEAP